MMDQISYIFMLLLVFQVKHFVADYLLQNNYMLGKFKTGIDWVLPLAAHAGVHTLCTLCILVALNQPVLLIWILPIDFCSHFIIDRVKASPYLLGRWKPNQSTFWTVLGMDQMLHHVVHYFIIYMIVRGR